MTTPSHTRVPLASVLAWLGVLAALALTFRCVCAVSQQQPVLRRRVPVPVERGVAGERSVALKVRVHVSRFQACPAGTLRPADFRITLNGTSRKATVLADTQPQTRAAVHLLIVLPPNAISVHAMAVADLVRSFSNRARDAAWQIGIVDSDGATFTATEDRTLLLQELERLRRKAEPPDFQAKRWFQAATEAVRDMASLWGPRMVLFVNPPAPDESVQAAESRLARVGPESLADAAKAAQVQIFVANQAGPGLAVPFGDASTEVALGSPAALSPETFRSADERQTQRLAAYQSGALLLADETGGAVAFSAADAIHRIEDDQGCQYELSIPLTPADLEGKRLILSILPHESRSRVVLLETKVVRGEGSGRP